MRTPASTAGTSSGTAAVTSTCSAPATSSASRSRRSVGDDPILILDDVFAELDTERREKLAELVAGAEQVLVTAAVPQDVPAALAGARIDVVDGKVLPGVT